jgi:hypothetical protein
MFSLQKKLKKRWGEGERERKRVGSGGRNGPNNVCTYEKNE